MIKILAATKEDKRNGWRYGFEFINHIAAETSSMQFPVGMEEVESVLFALEKNGYIKKEDKR